MQGKCVVISFPGSSLKITPPQLHSTESIQGENKKQEEDQAHVLIQLWRDAIGWAGEDCSRTAQSCWGK